MITITARVTGGSVFERLAEVEAKLLDLSPVFAQLPERVIFPSVMRSFAVGGRPAWSFKGYQSSPPMVKTGMMRRGLTTRDASLNMIRVTPNSFSFELNPAPFMARSMVGDWGRRKKGPGFFYPAAHQFGTIVHRRNLVLELQPEDFERIAQMIVDYATGGQAG